MIYHYDIQQGTDEWHEIKKGKMSASHAQAIGNNGKGLDTYIYQLATELFSQAERDNYTNKDMERGNELEPIARQLYEKVNNVKVIQVGFVEMNKYAGCSPDGLVGEDGLLEIKCPNDVNYFKFLIGESKTDPGWEWQIQMQLLITERKWCDLLYYNPNFKGKEGKIKRIFPDQEKQEKLITGLKAGEEKLKDLINKYND